VEIGGGRIGDVGLYDRKNRLRLAIEVRVTRRVDRAKQDDLASVDQAWGVWIAAGAG
jgi:hypothetical protein